MRQTRSRPREGGGRGRLAKKVILDSTHPECVAGLGDLNHIDLNCQLIFFYLAHAPMGCNELMAYRCVCLSVYPFTVRRCF